MKRKKRWWLLMGFTSLGVGMLAQKGTVAAGGDAFGSTGKVSYSIGQIAYKAVSTSSSGAEYQGIQQAYEVTDETGVFESWLSQGISLYPNPATDVLYLKADLSQLKVPRYVLLTLDGKLLQSSLMQQEVEQIGLEALSKGVYLVNVYSSDKIIKSFNLIKN